MGRGMAFSLREAGARLCVYSENHGPKLDEAVAEELDGVELGIFVKWYSQGWG